MKKSLVILLAASTVLAACSKEQKGKGGLLYTVHNEGGGTKIKEGDFIKIDFIQKNDKDSIMDATYDHEQSRVFPVGKKLYDGDMNDVLTLFGEGDSVSFKLNIDTMIFYNKQPRPEQFKDQKYLNYTIKIHKVLSKKPNEVDSVYQKRANEFFTADYKASLEKKKNSEAAKMKKYVEENNLKVTTSPSGLQYVIVAPGTGPKPVLGDTAIVDYTGKLTFKKVSGVDNVFDTSVKAIAEKTMAPNPMKQFTPTPIPLSEGIAKGFVEALQLIGKGGKVTVIIPSKLGYGEQGGGPIGPYSPLVFDIEIKDVKKGVAPVATPAPAPGTQAPAAQ